jgi:hypothetical protein
VYDEQIKGRMRLLVYLLPFAVRGYGLHDGTRDVFQQRAGGRGGSAPELKRHVGCHLQAQVGK